MLSSQHNNQTKIYGRLLNKTSSLDRLTYSRRYLIAISTLGLRNIHDKIRRRKRKEEFMPAEALDTHCADERQWAGPSVFLWEQVLFNRLMLPDCIEREGLPIFFVFVQPHNKLKRVRLKPVTIDKTHHVGKGIM